MNTIEMIPTLDDAIDILIKCPCSLSGYVQYGINY